MADLENLLLEAAGRTGAPGRNRHSRLPSRRRREGSYSDDGSDSKDDDSDDDSGYPSRKPSGSQVPLKKRLDAADKDDDQGSRGDDDEDDYEDDDDNQGGSGDESDVGSDLYKDDADREELAQMTELDREIILSERATKRDDQKLKDTVRAKQSGKKVQHGKETPPPPPTSSYRVRSSARSADKAAAKHGALNMLLAKKQKNQVPEGGPPRKLRNSSPIKRKSIDAMSPSSISSEGGSGSGSGSESESGSHSRDDDRLGGGDEDMGDDSKGDGTASSEKNLPTFEEIKDITLRRSKLGKWFMEPFFDDLIVGCFVRVGIGMSRSGQSIYRLCMVRNVDATDPDRQYKLENKTTHKYLNCIWGNESSAARWQMARVSDSPPLEKEFKEWKQEVQRSGGRMPSQQDVRDKIEAIQKTNTFVYSAATVKQMLQEKKSASVRPKNIAAEKERLRRELDVAESRHDEGEVERIRGRLQELEAMSSKGKEKDAKAVRLEEMNRKNRAENFKNASEMKPVNTSLKAGEAGYDPFSRRWTRSRNYYVSKPGGGDGEETGVRLEEEEVINGDGDGDISAVEAIGGGGGGGKSSINVEAGMAATAAALEAAADAGKLVDTSAPLDLGIESNSLHNFDLPISLTVLQKFGGPQGAHLGFMARKQQIEATIGYRVPENDGRRHALTLTVSDYKRRRGLL